MNAASFGISQCMVNVGRLCTTSRCRPALAFSAFRSIQFAYHPRSVRRLRQPHGLVSAIKQCDPQLFFQAANVAADRAGEKQLIRSGAEAAKAGGGFESGQVRQGVNFS